MSDGHTTAAMNDYTVTFHPAFASRCVVKGEDGECEVYKQNSPHVFKNGDKHPKKHKIRLEGGKYQRDITIEVDDPKLAIKQIHLELYPHREAKHIGSRNNTYAAAETFTAFNDAHTCPPDCDPTNPG